jgi:membrane associated rhomboid family serine protease
MIPLRDSQPSYSTPIVTITIIVANVLIFLYEVTLESFARNHFIGEYAMIPARFQAADLFTSMFLHGGWMHLIGNMWFLWIYGDNVEDILGRTKYVIFYLLSGAAAGIVHLVFNFDSRIPTVGASGAIAGVMGAYLFKFPRSRIVTLVPIFVFFTTFEIPAAIILVYWFVIQLFSGVGEFASMRGDQGGIAFFAHIGGFLAGIVLITMMRTRERYRLRTDLHW